MRTIARLALAASLLVESGCTPLPDGGDGGVASSDAPSIDASDVGPVAHSCAEARVLGAGGCVFPGSCHIACDFVGYCCIDGWQSGGCVEGTLMNLGGGDAGICGWLLDAADDASSSDTGCSDAAAHDCAP